ncbi:hypothetical protein T06_4617 [Trichinella sp. T6]|nr:hypothetical protein T06_4617 [Trichinella sp. T6]
MCVSQSDSVSQTQSSNKALVFFSRLCFGLYIRKTGRNTGENVTGISRDNSPLELDYRYRRGKPQYTGPPSRIRIE